MLACHSKQVTTVNKMICYPVWSCADLHESQSDLLLRRKNKKRTH